MEKENLKIKEIEKQTLSFGILKTNRWKNRQIFFFWDKHNKRNKNNDSSSI